MGGLQMKKITRYVAFGAAALALGASTAAEAKLKRITIGSNRQGSVFFLLASGFAKELQQQLKIKATAQPHAGSSVYIPLMDNGEITMGINNSMDSGAAVRGKPPFRSKNTNVRAIARVWIIPYGYLVKASSNIHTMADLKGKKVVTNIKPIVSLLALNKSLLANAGLASGDVTELASGGIVKNINMVVEGRVDAATAAMGMPVVRKAHATSGIRFIPVGAGTTDASLAMDAPGSRTYVAKPSKRFPFIKKTTKIIAFDSYLNAGKSVGNEDAYAFAKVLHTQWKKLQKAYGPLRGVKQNAIAPSGNPHLYHAGAVKYYKEAGIWSAANAKQQTKVAKQLK
jgi:uncharacterized protein